MSKELFLKNGNLFAKEFRRVVVGERGSYVEFSKDQIIPYLCNYFDYKSQENKEIYYKWLIPIYKLVVIEDPSTSYVPRTYRNATADVTLILAHDLFTAGEICTQKAVKDSKGLYLNLVGSNLSLLVDEIYSLNKRNITINVAGNGIKTWEKANVTQSKVDNFILESLTILKSYLEGRGITIDLIRSGGQTGTDEAGIKAALKLNIPALIVCPNGYRFRTIAQDLFDKEHFLERFSEVDSQEVKVYYQLKTVKYADYKIGFYYVSVDSFLDVKDPSKLF